jgi:hypothetical protein
MEMKKASDYLIKFTNPQTDAPCSVFLFFVRGGEPLTANVPVGRFTSKAASGERWCGESNLFAAGTTIVRQAGPYPRADGNLPARPIRSANF